ncbi:beta-galactosidase, partial [Candidatus Uhrbacteria bacterium]|nr:beta-galactosidase [Candidatus Uhrbacteria bacterium]
MTHYYLHKSLATIKTSSIKKFFLKSIALSLVLSFSYSQLVWAADIRQMILDAKTSFDQHTRRSGSMTTTALAAAQTQAQAVVDQKQTVQTVAATLDNEINSILAATVTANVTKTLSTSADKTQAVVDQKQTAQIVAATPIIAANVAKTLPDGSVQQTQVAANTAQVVVDQWTITPIESIFIAPTGYYVLGGVDQMNISAGDLKLPGVVGLSIRFSWSNTEPKPGVFDWSYVDQAVALAKSTGDSYMLRPMAGTSAPSWLYSEGVQSTISDPRGDGSPGSTMPLPWDATMLKEWAKFIDALGARYGSDTSLKLVHLSGPTGNSAEMHLPSALENTVNNALVIDAWKNVVNEYAKAFPNTAISLNASNAFSARDGVLSAVSTYVEQTLGRRATIQNNSLAGDISLSFAPVAIMSQFAQAGGRVGFQEVSASSNVARFGGTLEQALAIGRQVGAGYYEIYKTDLPLVAATPMPTNVTKTLPDGTLIIYDT